MATGIDKFFGTHEASMTVHSQRLQLLANNIANADTPGFKARDIDFRVAMQHAVSEINAPALPRPETMSDGLTMADPRNYAGSPRFQVSESAYRIPLQPDTGDGNTVDAQVELSNYAQSAQQYQTSLTFLNGKIHSLLSVIKGE